MTPPTLVQHVYQYCELHWDEGRKSIIAHFVSENHPKSTIYNIVKQWDKGLPSDRIPGCGCNQKSIWSNRLMGSQSHISQ